MGIVKHQYPQTSGSDEHVVDQLVNEFIAQRNIARSNKDFSASDAIRDRLDEIGIVLEDKPGETIWRKK